MSNTCCGDCFKCQIYCTELTPEEIAFSDSLDNEIKEQRRKEQIAQIDDPKARAVARYRITPKGKEMLHRSNTNEKAHERYRRYEKTNKAKERRKRHESKLERKEYKKRYAETYNKKYLSVVRSRKEQKRMEEASHYLDILLDVGSVSVCDGQRNRPRERQKYERILNIILERNLDVTIELNIDKGIVERRF